MAEEVIGISLKVDGTAADQSVGSFRKQLKAATADLITLNDKFGSTSKEATEAAKRVAGLKDQMADAKSLSEAFNPDKKFAAFSQSIRGVTGGFAGLQGAMALFGNKSEAVEKTLLKVQAALALSEGVNSVLDSVQAFKNLAAVISGPLKNAFTGLRGAIISTGIGALVIAVGLLIANFDKVKAAITGISKEQRNLAEDSKKTVEVEEKKLKTLDKQENTLKLQGKSEKEILQLKIAQTDVIIKQRELQLKGQQELLKGQIAAEKRNREILKGIIDFLSFPINAVLKVVNKIASVLGKDLNLGTAGDFLSGFVFDEKKVEEERNKEIEENKTHIEELKSQRAGFQLSINEIDKKAGEDRNKKSEEANKKREEENKKRLEDDKKAYEELSKLRDENAQKEIKDENERARVKSLQDFENRKKEIADLKVSDETKGRLLAEARIKSALELEEINDKIEEERLKKEKERIENQKKFVAGNKGSTLTNVEQQLALDNSLRDAKLVGFERELVDLENQYKAKLNIAQGNESLITQITKDYEEKRSAIQFSQAKQRADIVAGMLGKVADLVGRNAVAGKVIAVAEASINTFSASWEAFKNAQKNPISIIGPAYPYIQAGLAAAAGIANIKKIISVKVPGGGGGGGGIPSSSLSAPVQPQIATTLIDQQQVNQIGNAAVRAFVVETDVTDNQEKIRRLNRAARIG